MSSFPHFLLSLFYKGPWCLSNDYNTSSIATLTKIISITHYWSCGHYYPSAVPFVVFCFGFDAYVHHYTYVTWTSWHRKSPITLQWRHDGRNGVSNHQSHNCLLNRSLRYRSKKTSKLRVTGLCEGNSPVTGEFPAQRASNTENIFHLVTSSWTCLFKGLPMLVTKKIPTLRSTRPPASSFRASNVENISMPWLLHDAIHFLSVPA